MGEVCEICGGTAVGYFVMFKHASGKPLTLREASTPLADQLMAFCAAHDQQVELLMLENDWSPVPWTMSPRDLRERTARVDAERARAAAWEAGRPERVREQAEQENARYQKNLAELQQRFERARFKRSRIIAAWWLGKYSQARDPAAAAPAYEYIFATKRPKEHGELLRLAAGLRVVGSLVHAEELYREALALRPGDEDTVFGLVETLRGLERGPEADELVRQHDRLIALRGLLEEAIIHAKQYQSTGRATRIAPAVFALLDPDEEPQRALWSMAMPIPSGVGFAVHTDRRLLIVQDYEYLRSGTLLQPKVEHKYFEHRGELDRKLFPHRLD
jgi:tetratricopeptide (TPR) repeat protein